MKKRLSYLISAILILTLVAGIYIYNTQRIINISLPTHSRVDQPGDLVSIERVGKYPAAALQIGLAYYSLKTEALDNFKRPSVATTLYRIHYLTHNHDGTLINASGLIGVPEQKTIDNAVVFFHGTTVGRASAPSYPGSRISKILSATISGNGYLLIAPDYIGLGGTRTHHPYLHTETMVTSSFDLIHASQQALEILDTSMPPSIFLLGYSQGGHATLAVQRALEKENNLSLNLTASASLAGPVQLLNISFPYLLTGASSDHSFYLAYTLNAYSKVYNQSLNSFIKDDYAKSIAKMFDGNHSAKQIKAILPDQPIELFTEEFLDNYRAGRPHWFLSALSENSILGWIPSTPLRLYYGDKDIDVTPEEALTAEKIMNIEDSDVKAISVGQLDHFEMWLSAMPHALTWFDQLATTQ